MNLNIWGVGGIWKVEENKIIPVSSDEDSHD